MFADCYIITAEVDGTRVAIFRNFEHRWIESKGFPPAAAQCELDTPINLLLEVLSDASRTFPSARIERLSFSSSPVEPTNEWLWAFRQSGLAKLSPQEIEALNLESVAIQEKLRGLV